MYEYSIAHWTTFFLAAFLLNITPGVDMAFILTQTLKNGQRAGFAAMFGLWGGTCLHVLLAATGLSAILLASALAISVVKWLGAFYLLILGFQTISSKQTVFSTNMEEADDSNIKIFQQGILISALNPKVAVFFLAFLPQFVVEGAGPISGQFVLHGMLILVVAAFIEPLVVVLGAKLNTVLTQNQHMELWLNRGLGAVFIALAGRLAFIE